MDDFAPRHELSENMQNLIEYAKKSGHNYGKYVQANPDPPREPTEPEEVSDLEENKVRFICKHCGKVGFAKTKSRKYHEWCREEVNRVNARRNQAKYQAKKKEEAERNKRLWASGAFV